MTPEQQELFVQAAHLVAAQDGEVSELESALLDGFAEEVGLEGSSPSIEISEALTRVADALEPGPTRRAFMLELAGIAVIDGELHPAELERLGEFADALDISKTELEGFIDFAGQAKAVAERGQALISTASEAA